MSAPYVELHCHSNYSFKEGASFISELLQRASELDYPALALTDHNNLCGAMEFADSASLFGIQPIAGVELDIMGGHHLTLLAESRQGYANISNLVSFAYMKADRLAPELDPRFLADHAEGTILLTGCRKGKLPSLVADGKMDEAEEVLRDYLNWFGVSNVFVELQQNLWHGDTERNRALVDLAHRVGVGYVATGNVHYHIQGRHRLHQALTAIQHNKRLDDIDYNILKPNPMFYLKHRDEMAVFFESLPAAISNTTMIAERCSFNVSKDLNYQFPDYPVPEGYTPQTYLEKICHDAALRRYGTINDKVRTRLDEEFRLIGKHNLAGFFLIYYEIIQMARDVMIDLGLSDPEIPLEERPPGRGRGSSVSMLVGYLIGLSHIDPLMYDLSFERFIQEDMVSVPDIDLDFPRNIRAELIKRVHAHWGWERAALTGMISTYQTKGAVRDLGKVLGLPQDDIDAVAKRSESSSAKNLANELAANPKFRDRLDAPVWRELIELAYQLDGFPKYLAQHPGGMIISSTPLIDVVPVRPSAIADRYIMDWDKNSIDTLGAVKIDFLALGALSQMQEALILIEQRTGHYPDLSRVDGEDSAVYDMLHRGDTIGLFQVESPAQRQTITRIRPKNLTEMAWEVGAVRPGVGANDGVSQFIKRLKGEPWDYDHPLESRALERTFGVILYQDQPLQLAVDVAGFTASEADQLRRTFGRRNNESALAAYWDRFRDGAATNGVNEETAAKVFGKFNPHYMFPEAHAFAFGVTAYHMAWLKYYYPLEFYVGIFNQQPMGSYSLESLKQDAKRRGVYVLNPDINHSVAKASVKDESVLLGLSHVFGVGAEAAESVRQARDAAGPFLDLGDAMRRTGLRRLELERLTLAGAFDSMVSSRKEGLWEIGLRYRPASPQKSLDLPVQDEMVSLRPETDWEHMTQEYQTLGLYPSGHYMEAIRHIFGPEVLPTHEIGQLADGTRVVTAGIKISFQRPLGKMVFITLEDEWGDVPISVFPRVYERFKDAIRESVIKIGGRVARRDGTMNVSVDWVVPIRADSVTVPKARHVR
jgi:error-prone DNA polymerase